MIWVIQTTGAGTWTVPSGIVNPVTVHCWGGGGGGGSGDDSNGAGCGGGGGGYAGVTYTMTVGNVYNVNVGAGGAADVDGGDTWFSSSTAQLAGGGGCGDNADDGSQGGGPGGGTGETSWQTGNPLSTNIGTNSFIGGYGAQGTSSSSGLLVGNIGGPAGGSATACQNGVTPANLSNAYDSRLQLLVYGIGQGCGGSGAVQADSMASTAGSVFGGGGGAGASSSLTASAGGNGVIVIIDSAAPTVNNYIGGGTGSWTNPASWSLGRIPQHGDAITFVGSTNGGPNFNQGPSSLLVIASMDTSGAAVADICGTNPNLVIAPGGTLVMGTLGPWGGNAASAASCTFNSQKVGGGLVNNATFNGTAAIENNSVPYSFDLSGFFGVTVWNSSQGLGLPGKPLLFAPATHGAKNLRITATAMSLGFALSSGAELAAGAGSGGLQGHSYEMNVEFAIPPRRAW
jgi:hypothetical protein